MSTPYLVTQYSIPVYMPCGGSFALSVHGTPTERWDYYHRRMSLRPRNYRVATLADGTTVQVVFFDLCRGRFLIQASGQAAAYAAVRALDGFFVLAVGHVIDRDMGLPRLIELKRVPQAHWPLSGLDAALARRAPPYEIGLLEQAELLSGRFVTAEELSFLGPYVEGIHARPALSTPISHLTHSLFLFNGYMVDSYYHFHYRHDRAIVTKHEMEKRFLEHRESYELAFLSAFKGIESFLGGKQVRQERIAKALDESGSPMITPETTYTRRHEIFSGHQEKLSYAELVDHFLHIRNAVAAHANAAPPPKFWISEDTLCEIQRFLSQLCHQRIGELAPRSLPPRAIVPQKVAETSNDR